MKKRLLLTGTAGFIGSNLIRKIRFEKHPYELYSVDKIANSSMMNNIYQNKLHEFFIADICDQHIMDKIFEYVQPECVIHLAAESNVDKSIQDSNVFIHSNVVGTQILVNLALKYKVERFVHISTDEVLGSLTSKEDPLWTEEAPINPRNPYAASKASAELVVRAAGTTHGLPFLITRCSNNFGPRQTYEKFIPRIIKSILEDTLIPIYGKGEQIRDWIHVNDHCSAILKVLEKGNVGDVYNVSANHELSNLEVVQHIIELMGKGQYQFVSDRLGHDFRYGIDATKLRNLGWRPVYKFKDGLKQCIDWYMDNRFFLN